MLLTEDPDLYLRILLGQIIGARIQVSDSGKPTVRLDLSKVTHLVNHTIFLCVECVIGRVNGLKCGTWGQRIDSGRRAGSLHFLAANMIYSERKSNGVFLILVPSRRSRYLRIFNRLLNPHRMSMTVALNAFNFFFFRACN